MPGPQDSFVAAYLADSAATMSAFAADADAARTMLAMGAAIAGAMRAGRKLLVAGNGGSAADAQHIAGEFIARMMYDRAPLPAIALTTDSSALTATANDYGYEAVFERQVRGLGQPGDVFLGISTSGTSPNVLRALAAARAGGLVTLGFTGRRPGPMRETCDLLLEAPHTAAALVQQLHITAAHIVCALVEREMFPANAAR